MYIFYKILIVIKNVKVRPPSTDNTVWTAKNKATTKSVSSTTTVSTTSKVTHDDAAGDNGEPGQVGGVGITSERPGSAHDSSETDSQPVSVP